MKYVISDIHGRLDRLEKMVDLIELKEEDTLYVLGDMVDRGSEPIGVIKYIMKRRNIEVIMGNHDRMMIKALRYKDDKELKRWSRNGYETTLEGLNNLSENKRNEILDFIDGLEYFKIIDNSYLLVHAGYDPVKLKEDLKTMKLEDALMNQEERLVWEREKFFKEPGLKEYTVIFGHTPRPYIDEKFEEESELPYKIWFDKKYNNKICVDTGNCYEEGRMACLRLEDMKEFYID